MSAWEAFLACIAVLAVFAFAVIGPVVFIATTMLTMVAGGLAVKKLGNILALVADKVEERYHQFRISGFSAVALVALRRAWRLFRFVTHPIVALDRLLRPRRWAVWSYRLLTPPAVMFAILVTWALVYVYWSPGDRPDIKSVLQWEPLQIGNISDADGEVYFKMYNNEARRVVRFGDIKPDVYNAFVAAENGDFWTDDGWEKDRTFMAASKSVIAKVPFLNRIFRTRSQGGSTITQQVVRRVDPVIATLAQREKGDDPLADNLPTRFVKALTGRTFANRTVRKWREIKHAVHMETSLEEHFRQAGSKDPHRAAKELILQTYLNSAYFGHGVYGVDYAAEFFFQKKLGDLTVHECAFLASLLPAPNRYARLDSTVADMKVRRDEVLRRMAKRAFIDKGQLKLATAAPVRLNVRVATTKTEAPAAVNYVLYKELSDIGQERGDLLVGRIQVQTTLRMDIQRIVNQAAYEGIHGDGKPAPIGKDGKPKKKPETGYAERYPGLRLPQATVVVMGPQGQMLALYGGEVREEKLAYNAQAQLSRVLSPNQAGSTYKVVDDAAAMEVGYTPDIEFVDAPVSNCMRRDNSNHCIEWKSVSNYEDDPPTKRSLREWSARSNNRAFMNLMKFMVGSKAEAATQAAIMTKEYHQPVEPGAAMAIKWGREMGIQTPLQPYISTVLGGSDVTVLDMATVINSVCTGNRVKPFLISAVSDNSGTIRHRNEGSVRPLPLEHDKLVHVQELLYGNVRLPKGTGHSLDTSEFGIEVLGKTGTTNGWRDAWFIGCNQAVAIAVHVGYDDNTPMPGEGLEISRRASGGWVALPIFRKIMLALFGPGKPLGEAPKIPDEVKEPVNAYLARTYPTGAK